MHHCRLIRLHNYCSTPCVAFGIGTLSELACTTTIVHSSTHLCVGDNIPDKIVPRRRAEVEGQDQRTRYDTPGLQHLFPTPSKMRGAQQKYSRAGHAEATDAQQPHERRVTHSKVNAVLVFRHAAVADHHRPWVSPTTWPRPWWVSVVPWVVFRVVAVALILYRPQRVQLSHDRAPSRLRVSTRPPEVERAIGCRSEPSA
eukprot:SAG31_NODE_13672_length_854_cov_0.961589_2_plen_199_part_01